jgi:hypothetical protein
MRKVFPAGRRGERLELQVIGLFLRHQRGRCHIGDQFRLQPREGTGGEISERQ